MSDLLNDLRGEPDDGMRFDEEEGSNVFTDFSDFDTLDNLDDDPRPPTTRERRSRGSGRFLGMTAGQRFVLVLMLFLLSLMFSSACLIITGKVVVF